MQHVDDGRDIGTPDFSRAFNDMDLTDELSAKVRRLESELVLMERRALNAELTAANWRQLYECTQRDLEACRSSWSTCQRLKCCSCLTPPCDVEVVRA